METQAITTKAAVTTESKLAKKQQSQLDKLNELSDKLSDLIKARDEANTEIVKLEAEVKKMGVDLVEEVPVEKLRPSQLMAYFGACGEAEQYKKHKSIQDAWGHLSIRHKQWLLNQMNINFYDDGHGSLSRAFPWSITRELVQNYLNNKRLVREAARRAKRAKKSKSAQA